MTNEIPNQLNQRLRTVSSRVVELIGCIAAAGTTTCPICRIVGPFRGDPETDAAQQVSNHKWQ